MKGKPRYEILHEDDSIVVLSKPTGIFTIPDRFIKDAPNLYGMLKKKFGEIFVVHRLDRDTSGVMIFAKTAEAHKHLNIQFDKHEVKKIYHVVVSGYFREDNLNIDIPLAEHPGKKGMTIPTARGKESLTIVKVLERFRAVTLLECELVTGRHHQIRVHCAAVGHPLLVDELYGNSSAFNLSTIKRRYNIRKNEVEKPLISRVTMHAREITFIHPCNNVEVTYSADYPKDFTALLQVLRKYAAVPDYKY